MIQEQEGLSYYDEDGLSIKQLDSKIDKESLYKLMLHDLKNPILGIFSLTQYLSEKSGTEDLLNSEQYIKYNQMIFDSSQSLLNLLESFKIFFEVDTLAKNQNFQISHMNPLVSSAIATACIIALRKNIIIHCNLASCDVFFCSDFLTSAILRNLLTNAIKFTPRNGSILISTFIRGDFLEVSIKDSGIGMTQVEIEKLFNMKKIFTKLGTDKEKGSGLGLFFCQDFIHKQNGKLSIESVPQLGSNFVFTLPLNY